MACGTSVAGSVMRCVGALPRRGALPAGGRRGRRERTAVRRCTPYARIETSGSGYAEAEAGGGSGGGGDKGKPGTGGDGGGGGGDGEAGKYWGEVGPFLAGLGQTLERFPAEFRKDVAAGLVPLAFVQRYIELQASLVMRALMKIPGFRNKLLADPNLAFKLGIEIGIGILTKCSAEYQKRKPNFRKEIDFAFANLLMALIADWMLVYLPAPTMVFNVAKARKTGVLASAFPFVRTLPKNAFQKVPVMMKPFTVTQRVGALGVNGVKLFTVGTFASFVGVALTNILTEVRQRLNPDAPKLNKPQNVVKASLLYGSYMGINSNLRYQLLAGIEERYLSALFTNPGNFALVSGAVRVANTYLGSLMWVDTLRLVGMQPQKKG
ncbi:protein RETICULATA-related [Chloropicon primus]|uniref:Uncharacterized protein n=2 Tax=Chloropicon primus TaxID=1764295 RepID=A0A5B8MSV6_9CHLO|nr:hypothetical protein A3770_10p59490 [Chloropicon primus]UPR02643.1 protein RETICULATA-related [Chloropicon primus]|eukprot:QDZ23431.1 hypothetical protein A3770_10p59490 [Chloropicon primus]